MKIYNPKNLILRHKKTGRIYKTTDNTDYIAYDENAFENLTVKKQESLGI